jgi:hypothetical protein
MFRPPTEKFLALPLYVDGKMSSRLKLTMLVFDWHHFVDKITIMYCCCFHRNAVYFKVFRYSEFISLMRKESYYDKLQVSQAS